MHLEFDSCRDHWICFLIYPKEGRVLVLDSVDYPKESYAPFIKLLEL
jgi:hypothetical protein